MTDQLDLKRHRRGVSGLLPGGGGCDADTRTIYSRYGTGAADWRACGGGTIRRRGGRGPGRGSLPERHAEGRSEPIRGPLCGSAQLWPFSWPDRDQSAVYRRRHEWTIDVEVHHPHGSEPLECPLIFYTDLDR
jgi:hypothetical protein